MYVFWQGRGWWITWLTVLGMLPFAILLGTGVITTVGEPPAQRAAPAAARGGAK
jgi:hypothetical protein